MELTINLLENLKDSGKSIAVHSKCISKLLLNYSSIDFKNFSRTSFYYWLKEKRPIPLEVVLFIMNDNNLIKLSIEYLSINGGNKIKFPSEEDIGFSYLLGLILGDGCLIHNKRSDNRNTYLIKITFREKSEAVKIRELVKILFGINSSIYPGRGCYDLCVYSKPLVLILNKKYQIPIGKKYNSICVPLLILNGTANMKKSFLKGVFESDGNLYNHRGRKVIQLRQKSGKFLNGLRNLFLEFNLNFNKPYFDKANNSWVLWSSRAGLVDNFINDIIEFNSMPG